VTKRGSEGGIEGDDTGHVQGQRLHGKKRRVESSREDTVVWETIQTNLKHKTSQETISGTGYKNRGKDSSRKQDTQKQGVRELGLVR